MKIIQFLLDNWSGIITISTSLITAASAMAKAMPKKFHNCTFTKIIDALALNANREK